MAPISDLGLIQYSSGFSPSLQDTGVRTIAVSRLLDLLGAPPPGSGAGAGAGHAPGGAAGGEGAGGGGGPVPPAPAHLPLMETFLSRFTARFKELVYDVDEGVAALGVSFWEHAQRG